MKKIAITSLIISIISLIMVAFLYAPKIKRNQSVNQADIYQQQIVELFPELKYAVNIDTAQNKLYSTDYFEPTYFYSILNNVPIVGFHDDDFWLDGDMLVYQFFHSEKKTCYWISFEKMKENEIFKLRDFSTKKCNALEEYVSKKILGSDTLIELSYHDKENRYHRYYSLKKENEIASRLIRFDWDFNYGDHSLNTIRIASRHWKDFKVIIATEYNKEIDLFIPSFEGKSIGVKVYYGDQEYKTTAILSDSSNISEKCFNPNYSKWGIQSNCHFTLNAPFENCNLKLNVRYDNGLNALNKPIIEIKNELIQLMQCLNVW